MAGVRKMGEYIEPGLAHLKRSPGAQSSYFSQCHKVIGSGLNRSDSLG